MLQLSLPLQPGNSGGPLFTEQGELAGIVVASLDMHYIYEHFGTIPQNVNFAVKSEYLLNLLEMLPDYKPAQSPRSVVGGSERLISTVVQVLAK
jgi:S1-C subfamily serine protease